MLKEKSQTIALFGGSFDPPHSGHEAIVYALLELDYIDRVVVMPTYLNPFKNSSFAPAKLRLQWLKSMFFLKTKVFIDDYEVNQNKKVPTIESVLHLLKSYKAVYVVIGADNLQTLSKWQNYKELKELVTFIVAQRQNIEVPSSFIHLNIDENISSSMLRDSLLEGNLDKSKIPQAIEHEILKYYKEIN